MCGQFVFKNKGVEFSRKIYGIVLARPNFCLFVS